MLILTIDTALEACSVALLDTARPEDTTSDSRPMVRGHAEALMPMIAGVMDRGRIEFAALDRLAVTVGPGSFTGLRVGISAARGIALAAGKPVAGLSTLAALAAPSMASEVALPIVVAIDARHAQCYLQVFAPDGRTLVSPRIAPIAEAARAASQGEVRIIGSAASAVADACGNGGLRHVDERRFADIGWVARLGAAAQIGAAPPKPLYLRAPDAQPQDAARLPRR